MKGIRVFIKYAPVNTSKVLYMSTWVLMYRRQNIRTHYYRFHKFKVFRRVQKELLNNNIKIALKFAGFKTVIKRISEFARDKLKFLIKIDKYSIGSEIKENTYQAFNVINETQGLRNNSTYEESPHSSALHRTVYVGLRALSQSRVNLRHVSNSDYFSEEYTSIKFKFKKFKQRFLQPKEEIPTSEDDIHLDFHGTKYYYFKGFRRNASPSNLFSKMSLYGFLDAKLKIKAMFNNKFSLLSTAFENIKSKVKRKIKKKKTLKTIASFSYYSKIYKEAGILPRIYSMFTHSDLPMWNGTLFVEQLRLIFIRNRFAFLKSISRMLYMFRFGIYKRTKYPAALNLTASGLIKKLGRSNFFEYELNQVETHRIDLPIEFVQTTTYSRYGITSLKLALIN